jgi:hypothetical protein
LKLPEASSGGHEFTRAAKRYERALGAEGADWTFQQLSGGNRHAPINLISPRRKPHHAPYLLFDIPLITQLGHGHTRERGIDCLLRQSHELTRIVLIVLDESDEKFGLDRLWLH